MAQTIQHLLDDPLYANWVKANLALNITKNGIQEFADVVAYNFQQRWLSDICVQKGLPKGTVCNSCTTQNVVICPTAKTCSIRGNVCNYHDSGNPSKQYRPCPVTVIINQTDFQDKISEVLSIPNNLFSQKKYVRKMRNEIVNNTTHSISTDTMHEYIDNMMQLLSTTLPTNLKAHDAISKLYQLKQVNRDGDESKVDEEGTTTKNEEIPEQEYLSETQTQPLPAEILRMDDRSIELYKQTLAEGNEASYNIRLMIVGHCGVGKTALTRRLLGEGFDESNTTSTDGIDLHQRCRVNLQDGEWTVSRKDEKSDEKSDKCLRRLARLLHQYFKEKADENSHIAESGADAGPEQYVADTSRSGQGEERDSDVLYRRIQDEGNDDRQPQITADNRQSKTDLADIVTKASTLNVNDVKEEAEVSIWDFAGQYIYYCTHQVFHSRRAIYLLVTDISQDIDDVVTKDDLCNFDSDSTKCKISEYVEFWLNSIHSYCTPGFPPVILVGTHADQAERPDDFFEAIRHLLDGKSTCTMLEDGNFPIENKIDDPRLEDLKQKILKVAEEQTYWGELIPAKWITLEQKLIALKGEGCKIIERSHLSKINESMRVPLRDDTEKEELDLFLRFHHESGSILYFSDEPSLNDFILLDPQWLVDALKCVITAREFCKDKAALYTDWITFKKTAILRQDLIDAIWKDKKQKEASGTGRESFYTHRKHIILLMEKLDIIAKPKIMTDDMPFRKEESFYYVPCCLTNDPPEDVINSDSTKTTSTLCFKGSAKIYTLAIYSNLLAACLSNWPLAKQGSNYHIYRGCGLFYLDDSKMHILKVQLNFSQNVIQMWVSSMDDIDSSHSIGAKEFIMSQLKCLGKFVTYIKCPTCGNHEELDQLKATPRVRCDGGDGKCHMLESSQLLQYWFTENLDQQNTTEYQMKRNYPKYLEELAMSTNSWRSS